MTEPNKEPRKRRWWRRRRVWLLGGLLALIACHSLILRALVSGLVVKEPIPDRADAVMIVYGDYAMETAIDWFERGYCELFLLEKDLPLRTDVHQISSPRHERKRQILIEAGIPADKILLIGDDRDEGEWRRIRSLADWLKRNPTSRVVVLYPSLWTRRLHYILDILLSPQQRVRVFTHGLEPQTFDWNHWWKSREGAKQVFGATMDLLYAHIKGEDTMERISWDIDEYERRLKASWHSD